MRSAPNVSHSHRAVCKECQVYYKFYSAKTDKLVFDFRAILLTKPDYTQTETPTDKTEYTK